MYNFYTILLYFGGIISLNRNDILTVVLLDIEEESVAER